MALKFSELHGQPGVLEELKRSFTAGSVVHAFFIHGDEGCGKKTLAQTLSMALHCENTGEKPCMECGSCVRMLSGSHPDHVWLSTDKASISVQEIRDLIDRLSDRPYEGGKRTVVIVDCDKMTDSAQNAFLKTLEEPDGQTVFFLLTSHPEAVLTTIRSRCRPVYMPRLSNEVIYNDLLHRGISQEKAKYLSNLCEGVLGRALTLQKDDDPYYAYRAEAVRLMKDLRHKEDVPKVLSKMDDKRKAEDSLQFLSVLEAVLRDLWREKAELPLMDSAIDEELSDLGRHFSIDAVSCIMEELTNVRKRLNAHVQWKAAVWPMLQRIVEERKL